jgi:two-component system, LuxR family, sensor kinase FixL
MGGNYRARLMELRSVPLDVKLDALDMAQVMMRDLDGTIRFWSRALGILYGFPAERALGRRSHEMLHTIFPRPLTEIEAELQARGQWHGELVHRKADGDTVVVASHWSLGTAHGVPIVTEVNNDITDRRNNDAARFRLAAIVESSEDAIVGKTLAGIVTSWNAAAEAMFGYSEADMVGQSILRIVPPELHEEENTILGRLARGERIRHFETTRRDRNGRRISVALTISPIRNEAGQIVGASKIAREITRERAARQRLAELESELAQLGRLTAMGEIAAALSHELQQPVTALTNYGETLAQMLESGQVDRGSARLVVDKMGRQVLRTGEVIRRIRDFIGRRGSLRSPESVNELVGEAVELVRIGAGTSGVRILVTLDPEAGTIHADRVQIEQVLVNLLRNAMDVLEHAARREISVSTRFDREASTVVITVADTGPGIAPEIAGRLFQPFVTSKPSGLGIGLSISSDIVRAHGGAIAAGPRPGGGTIFTVTLPALLHDDARGL